VQPVSASERSGQQGRPARNRAGDSDDQRNGPDVVSACGRQAARLATFLLLTKQGTTRGVVADRLLTSSRDQPNLPPLTPPW